MSRSAMPSARQRFVADDWWLSEHAREPMAEASARAPSSKAGTIGAPANDVWRQHPGLKVLHEELESIANKNILNPHVHCRLHDWFETGIYRHIYNTHTFEFNPEGKDGLFSGSAEVEEALRDLQSRLKEEPLGGSQQRESAQASQQSGSVIRGTHPRTIDYFVKAVNTLRSVLVDEFAM